MKKILSIVFIALFILGFLTTAFAQDADKLWKERASQASEKLKEIKKKMTQNDSEVLKFEGMVESAYAMIMAAPEVTVKKSPAIAAYHLLLSYDDDGMLDVVYLYDLKTHKYLGLRVDRLPKNRGIVCFQGKMSDFITISNYTDVKEPKIMFSKSDPFKVYVLEK
jgi:hypothetical protein